MGDNETEINDGEDEQPKQPEPATPPSPAAPRPALPPSAPINWRALKVQAHQKWKDTLWLRSLDTMRATEFLKTLNEVGVYHRVADFNEFLRFREVYTKKNLIPMDWLTKGRLPGLWCSLFAQVNCFKIAKPPIGVIQIKFKPDFKLYNPDYEPDVAAWKKWEEDNTDYNEWEFDNDKTRMIEKLKLFRLPIHALFYEQLNYGAAVGHEEAVQVVILDPKCVEKMEFIELAQP